MFYMENEIWKPIQGFDSYLVSNIGRVMRLGGKVHAMNKSSDGYIRATFRTSRTQCTTKKVHRLVAIAFIPNPNNYPSVNHIDGNKENNAVWNLEWCTHKMNMKHAADTGLTARGVKCNKSKLTESQIHAIRQIYDAGLSSQRSLAAKYKVAKNAIKMIVNRKSWKHI